MAPQLCSLLFLVFVTVTAALPQGQGQDPSVDLPLPPPVKPEPRQINGTLPTPVKPEPRQSTACNYVLPFSAVGQSALLQSPNFPNDYSPRSSCRYSLTSPAGTLISLQCNEFNVEASNGCIYDVLYFSRTGDSQFRDALKACGRGTLAQTSTTNALTIGFDSDAGNPYSPAPYRFNCTLTVVPGSGVAPAPAPTSAPATTAASAPTAAPTQAPVQSNTTSTSGCECGVRNESPRIVGGTYASVNEFPWRCNLNHPTMGAFCGATVISNQWVLTAAHCTAAVPAGTIFNVDCADHDITSATESANVNYPIAQVIQHPLYNKETQDNDISLIRLKTPLTFSRTIQPICLPWNLVDMNVEGKTVTASGWGTTSSGGQQSVILKKVDLPVLSTTQCQGYYGSSVTNNMICTYSAGSDTCQGDSGGSIDYKNPATGRYYDLGVVSWGVGCAGTRQPGVYAKVTNYLNWITENTAGAPFCRA